MALSDADLAATVIAAGFPRDKAVTAVAVALAESGGNPTVLGDIKLKNATWGPSVGLFQIRSLNAQKGSGGERDELANSNPATNAKHALSISNSGNNWAPWSTFTSGAYMAYLPRARSAVTSPGNADASGNTATVDSSNPVATGISTLTSPGTWLRMGAFILGGLLLVFTLYRATNAGQYVRKAVKTATKVAAVA